MCLLCICAYVHMLLYAVICYCMLLYAVIWYYMLFLFTFYSLF